MAIRKDRMGQAGHALEVEVENLFKYNGFSTEINHRTSAGEVDVIAEWENYHAAIECKEFNPSSTSRITRGMISNIAKKAEMIGSPNAILVVTKPPSDSLLEFARQAEVTVRSHEEILQIRENVLKHPQTERKRQVLIDAFSLSSGTDDRRRRKRTEFLRMVTSGKATRTTYSNEALDILRTHALKFLAGFAAIVVIFALGWTLVPAFQRGVTTVFYTLIALAITGGYFYYERRNR